MYKITEQRMLAELNGMRKDGLLSRFEALDLEPRIDVMLEKRRDQNFSC